VAKRSVLQGRGAGLVLLAIILVASSWCAHAQAPKADQAPKTDQAPKPANIDRNGVLMLVRSSLLALDQANKTGNYTVLRDLGAPGFQTANNPARLGDIFAKLRNDKVDLSGVAVIDPQLSLLPQIEASGLMHMAGFFPSVPSQVNFELLFAPVDGQWRLFGISVVIGQSAPAAPAAPEAPAPPAAAPKPETSAQKQPPPKPKQAAPTNIAPAK
jgi:hypothetical protein